MEKENTISKALKAGETIGVTIHQIEQSTSFNKSILERINSNKCSLTKKALEACFQLDNYQETESAYRDMLKLIQQDYSCEGKFLEKKLTVAIEEYRTHHRKECEYLAWKD